MSKFDCTCLILARPFISVEIHVQGESLASDDSSLIQKANSLHGGVQVEVRCISAGDAQAVVISSYRDLSEFLHEANAYGNHVISAMNRYRITEVPGHTSLADAYYEIGKGVTPTVWAMYHTYNGHSDGGHKVWLKDALRRELESASDSDSDSDSSSGPESVNIPSRTGSAMIAAGPQDEDYNALERTRSKSLD